MNRLLCCSALQAFPSSQCGCAETSADHAIQHPNNISLWCSRGHKISPHDSCHRRSDLGVISSSIFRKMCTPTWKHRAIAEISHSRQLDATTIDLTVKNVCILSRCKLANSNFQALHHVVSSPGTWRSLVLSQFSRTRSRCRRAFILPPLDFPFLSLGCYILSEAACVKYIQIQ